MSELPFLLSPYLRPVRLQGGLVFDNGITGTKHHLSALQEQIVEVLWPPSQGRVGLESIASAVGYEALATALDGLFALGMLFRPDEDVQDLLWKGLDSSLFAPPFVDQIELTNHCPMRCGFCPRGVEGQMHRPKGMMSLPLFERILAQLHPQQRHYRPIELHHLGESLLHPQLPAFLEAATKAQIPIELSANPSHLRPDLVDALLQSSLVRLVLSLDGIDRETLSDIRGPAAQWERAEQHLEYLWKRLQTLEHPPAIVLQMLDLQRNRHQHQAFLEKWNALKLPSVRAYIKDLDGPDPETGEHSCTPVRYLCSYPWRSVVILWDGRVVPCCRDADASLVLGHLDDSSLTDIWQGARIRQLREQHRTNCLEEGHLCKGCPWFHRAYADAMPERHPALAKTGHLEW